MTEHADEVPHSGHYFGDPRDFWWNVDFLALMAKRWQLDTKQSVLDVGCGIGHWGQILAPFFKEDVTICGVDPEPTWIKQATERAQMLNLSAHFEYQLGNAENLPFKDNQFDMVTCQTVLIHVPNVAIALKEMIRVLKPGGLLAVVEPNNIASMLVFDNLSIDSPIDALLENIGFQLRCERGKKALGLGYNSMGDILPYELAKQNLENIQVYLSDKISLLLPPYSSKEAQAVIHQVDQWQGKELVIWPKEETKKYYLAGGGSESEFDIRWPKLLKGRKNFLREIQKNNFSSTCASIMYLISGRKK